VAAHVADKSLSIKIKEKVFPKLAGQKIIAIHPFTSAPLKQWPLERFKDLAQVLIQEPGLKVAIIGVSDEKIDFAEGVINMINQTSLIELAAFLKRSSLLISSDSGPVHLAAAVGTPVVALFRNDLPGKTAKRWGPWGNGHIVIEKTNLNDIAVDEVMIKVKEVLNK
jgi:ADP-heptose:LPS heptosyltransferase